jgi:hypothetical protein
MTWHNRAGGPQRPRTQGPRRVGRRTASASRSYWSATSRTDGPSSRNASRPWQTLVLERPTGRPRTETTDIARHAAIRAAEPLRNQRAQAVAHLGLARAVLLEGRPPPGRIPHPRRPQSTHGPRMAPRSHRRPSAGPARQPSPAPRCSPQPLSPGPAGPPRPDGRRSSKPRCPTSPARSPSPAHRNRPDRTAARQAAAPLPPMLRHRAAPDRPCPRPDLRRSLTA